MKTSSSRISKTIAAFSVLTTIGLPMQTFAGKIGVPVSGGVVIVGGAKALPVKPASQPSEKPAIQQIEVTQSMGHNGLGGQTSFFLHNKTSDRVITVTYKAGEQTLAMKSLLPREKRFAWTTAGQHPFEEIVVVVGAYYEK
jgi:hypothetical protein